jgi:RNase P/RNase MRP subunit p29
MKNRVFTILCGFVFLVVNIAVAQNRDSTIVTIKTKSAGTHSGTIVSESADTIKLKTGSFGILSIAKNQILYENTVSVETMDGNEYLGELVREDDKVVVIKTNQLGEITINRRDIKKLTRIEVQQIKDGKFWFPNPQSTRYFWSPNGYGLKKGEGYYQNIWVLWNQFSYGLSDNLSIGGGIIPTFLFGLPTPVFGTLKFSVPLAKNKFNIGGGAIAGIIAGEDGESFGIVYGLATYGSPDANMTLGMGYGFAAGEWTQAPLININGMVRISRRGYFITENYVLTGGGETVVLLTLGGRSIIKKVALDYGLVIPFTSEGVPAALPWLGFTIPFGKTSVN